MADRPTTPGINLRVARKVVVSKDTAAALSDAAHGGSEIRRPFLGSCARAQDAPPPALQLRGGAILTGQFRVILLVVFREEIRLEGWNWDLD